MFIEALTLSVGLSLHLGFDTNYNPNSMSFHTDGEFQETDLSLSFVEERALRRQDIVKG